MRTLDVRIDIEVDRPTSEVFDFVADQTNAPLWQRGLAGVQRMTPPPVGVGTEHVFERRFAGMTIESRNRYTAYEPGRFVAFEIPSGKMTGHASYLVEPSGANSSRLASEMHFSFTGAAALFTPLLARMLERDGKKNLATLRDLLERTHANPQ